MKTRILAFAIFIFAAAPALFAQKDSKFFVNLQGGVGLSINENFAGFWNAKHGGNLFQGVGTIGVGYYFVPRFGMRLTTELARNASGANYQESNQVLRDYYFTSSQTYVDFILNGGNVALPKAFNWRFFGGLGWAHSFAFTAHEFNTLDDGHGNVRKYYIKDPNDAFSFRIGFILEYVFPCGVGIFFEGRHEFMTDYFNGVKSGEQDYGTQTGFPFDMRLDNSIGISYFF